MPQKIGLSLLFGIAALLAVWAVGRAFDWSRPRPVVDFEVAYVCLETQELVYGPVQPVPALNPTTGRRTLVRAVYSAHDDKWVAAPPEEVLRRQQQMLSGEAEESPLLFAPAEEEEGEE